MRSTSAFLTLLATLTLSTAANAARPYVTLVDDGTVATNKLQTLSDLKAIEKKILALYGETGAPLPEVISVWSTFDIGGSPYGTIYDPIGADVKGIGLEDAYPPEGIKKSSKPPLAAMLLHNNVLELKQRANLQGAPLEGFAEYLFLLELSHRFGPALRVPAPNPGALIGFDFHWSFWMDAGGSPSGGNVWKDNGDGTFTVEAQSPKALKFSMIDLYIMGLAAKEEVPPFGVLESVTPPTGITDPLWGGPYAAHSFPWFDASKPFTVTATRRSITIDDVIAANGTRDPAADAAPKTWTVGFVLLVGPNDDATQVSTAQTTFDPLANNFASAFNTATQGRGTLDVVTEENTQGTGGAGGMGGTGGSGGSTSSSASSSSGGGESSEGDCGCAVPGTSRGEGGAIAVAIAALAAARRRKRVG
ncbi:Putative hemagglutinin/hemolysin-related protein [Minicystis rosea]|nr:Putative hemagglutinin/hemolysin-related protein [Minicystis rosea]